LENNEIVIVKYKPTKIAISLVHIIGQDDIARSSKNVTKIKRDFYSLLWGIACERASGYENPKLFAIYSPVKYIFPLNYVLPLE